jgi:hypothetical protein
MTHQESIHHKQASCARLLFTMVGKDTQNFSASGKFDDSGNSMSLRVPEQLYPLPVMSDQKAQSDLLCMRLAHSEDGISFHISQCLPKGSFLISSHSLGIALKNMGDVLDYAFDSSGHTRFMRSILALWIDLLDKHHPNTIAAMSVSVLVRGFTAGLFKFVAVLISYDQHQWSREELQLELTNAIAPDVNALASKNIISIQQPNFFSSGSNLSPRSSAKKDRSSIQKSNGSHQSSNSNTNTSKSNRGSGSGSNSRNSGGGKGKSASSSSSQSNSSMTKSVCFSHMLEAMGGAPYGCSHGPRCPRDHDLSSMSKDTLTRAAAGLKGTHGDAVRAHVATLP